ncbi:MAG: uridine kinase [Clostridium sp.]|nr:uridine kinase [Clostridium sp.]
MAKLLLQGDYKEDLGDDTMLISQDVVRRDILHTQDGENTLALPLLKQMLEYGYNNCEIVILEGILRSDWYFDLFELASRLYENNIFAYYYEIPFEITIERYKTKSAEIQSRFNENDMCRWYVEKDYIGFINEKTLDENLSVEDAVILISNDID